MNQRKMNEIYKLIKEVKKETNRMSEGALYILQAPAHSRNLRPELLSGESESSLCLSCSALRRDPLGKVRPLEVPARPHKNDQKL